jgi:hypothetical protein
MRYFKLLAFCALVLSQESQAGVFDRVFRDAGKTIEKSVQDVGKTIEKSAQDAGKTIEKPIIIEHSPSDPCKNNPQLPQCKDIEGIQRGQ